MRKLVFVCLTLASVFSLKAQTGNVLIAQINSPYTVTPTSIDSTTTVSVQFNNTLSIANTAIFTGLDAPFSTSLDSLVIAGYDSAIVDIIFTPNSVGNFSDTLDFNGTIFGGGQIILNGEGVLVVISASIDSLNLGSISLGTSITDSFMVYNTGTGGTMAISNISSDNTDFIVNPNTATIAEGDSMYVYVTFSPVLTGVSTATIGIESNDPNNPTYNIYIEGTAVSQISGEICGTLSLINSPYTLIGDITVADSCILIIEPGVIVNCAQYSVLIDGTLQAIGTSADSIIINDFSTIAMNNRTASDTINYVSFNSDNTSSLVITNKINNSINNTTINTKTISNSTNSVFTFENGQWPAGWSYTGNHSISSSSGNPGYGIYANIYDYDENMYTNSFYLTEDDPRIILDYKRIRQDYNSYARFYFRINGGIWVQYYWDNCSNCNGNDWQTIDYTVATASAGDTLELRFLSDVYSTSGSYDEVRYYIDNLFIFEGVAQTTFNNCLINADLTTSNDLILETTTINASSISSINSRKGNITINNSIISGGSLQAILARGDNINVSIYNSTIKGNSGYGIYTTGNNSDLTIYNTTIRGNNNHGIYTTGSSVDVNIKYSFIKDNGSDGIYQTGGNSTNPVILTIDNSSINDNGGRGINQSTSYGSLFLDYCNITDNVSYGIYVNGIAIVNNSILWNNEYMGAHRQIYSSNGVTNVEYSSIMGLYTYGLYPIYGTSGQFYVANALEEDPMYLDTLFHIHPTSGVVDGGDISELDSIMPEGLGSPIADMGMYGGPANWFWGGGTPVSPSFGAPILTTVEDIPQDQGSNVALSWDASLWDDYTINNRVEEYSIWRHLDIDGLSIDSVENGTWELMGYTPAQAFNAYGYVSLTLGDSNLVSGDFNSCFIVKAHTSIPQLSYISNVLCGYSVDNLAPASPVASALANADGTEVTIFWEQPTIEDYSYSSVFSNNGFASLGVIDTLTYDFTTLAGNTYSYGVVHYDVNGNASDTAWVTITIDDNEDLIPLTAGWNLISTNQTPNQNNMSAIFSTLMPGNLVYVTGFNQGSSLYNPNGLPFLNTLNQFTDGYGYWVKVLADDTLRITGSVINPNYKIDLMPGWNLSGYMNPTSQDPSVYFDTLISNNNLIYCTGFNQGTQLFNPNGLPFLNSLTSMSRPYGYWIKVNTAVNGGNYRLANNEGSPFNPDFMFVNGTSNLKNHVGEYIEVLNSTDILMAKLEILEDGYLMTTPLYGDDVTTDFLEGLQNGENLTFRFNGQEIISDFGFEGNMELRQIDLDFSNGDLWSVYPNPLTTSTTINYELSTTSYVSIKVFDVTGRQIDELVNASQEASNHTQIWDASYFEKGVYMIELHINGVKVTGERIVKQ